MTLNSAKYYDSIVFNLTILRTQIKSRSMAGYTDLNLHCEDFVKEILNRVYGYQLINLNHENRNFPGLDVGDANLGIAFQITANNTLKKVKDTLKICLSTKAFLQFPTIKVFVLTIKQKSYSIKDFTKDLFEFSSDDILDFDNIYPDILKLDLDKRRELAEYIQRELPFQNNKIDPSQKVIADQLTNLEGMQTGGDSFCHFMLYHFDLKEHIAQNLCIIKTGKFPLYDLRYKVMEMNLKKDIFLNTHGELNSPADCYALKWKLGNSLYYRIFFFARNGSWNQDLILIKSDKQECWLAATIVRDKFGEKVVFEHIDDGFSVENGPPTWLP